MESSQPGQEVFVWDEEWFHEPSHDTPPTKVPSQDAETSLHTDDVTMSQAEPHWIDDTTDEPPVIKEEPEMLYWFDDTPTIDEPPVIKDEDEPSPKKIKKEVTTQCGEDIPPSIKRSARKVIRRWNLDRTTKVIVGPEGVRFLNATDFMLSAEEWRTWCNECDKKEILLSEDRDDKCTLLHTEYGVELRRKRGLETTKFHLSKYQCKALDYRANYITDHLGLLRENASPIHIMKSVIATKLMDMAAKLNLGLTYPVVQEETFDAVLENAVSLGITSEALRDFSSEMRIRGMHCGLDHYSLFFYCMFQLSALRELIM